jgi:CubicO group peptidase (beta-lactamase class C family)
MAKFQRTAICSLLLLCAPSLWATQTPAEKADALLTGIAQTNDPGFAVLVAQDGKILFEKGYGLADRERGVLVTPQTNWQVFSSESSP